MVQASQSGRNVYLVSVAQGNVYAAPAGALTWTQATNTTGDNPPLIYNGPMQSAVNGQVMYFADGTNWVKYTPRTNTVSRWSATAGTLPVDANNRTPRLIRTWRGRTLLAGLLGDPQSLFVSRVDTPTDFDYGATPDGTEAYALTTGRQGFVGDNITSICDFNDDVCLVFCDHTIVRISGDLADGGKKDFITELGGTWMNCWCRDAVGQVMFLSNHCGAYLMPPNGWPQWISAPIDPYLKKINTGENQIRVTWDQQFKEMHIFVTTAASAGGQVFSWESRTGAWWQGEFFNPNHYPTAACSFDGNLLSDRKLFMGGWDGFVRGFDSDAADDDGSPIESEVLVGQTVTKYQDEVMVHDLQPVLGTGSGDVDYAVYVGRTAEQAVADILADEALEDAGKTKGFKRAVTGTWKAGRNTMAPVRRAGHAVEVLMRSREKWSMEQVRVGVSTRGLVRRRN
jgi:hypothetical protein